MQGVRDAASADPGHVAANPTHAPPRGGVIEDVHPSSGGRLFQDNCKCTSLDDNPIPPDHNSSSPDKPVLSFPKWCSQVVPMLLRTRTPLGAFVAKTFQLSRLGRSDLKPTPSYFPIPIPFMGIGDRMPAGAASKTRKARAMSRLVHTIVMGLNYWYGGG